MMDPGCSVLSGVFATAERGPSGQLRLRRRDEGSVPRPALRWRRPLVDRDGRSTVCGFAGFGSTGDAMMRLEERR
jgi:hypothetical protein